jgi:putative hydrolase of the HAD superfamily
MGEYRACLIDVYETVLSCDFSAHAVEMPALAGVGPELWNAAFRELATEVTEGRLSMFDAFAEIMRRAGVEPSDEHVHDLVRWDRQLLLETSTLHADTVPFLELLRGKGVATALVSNCAENTGPLLRELGLSQLVDTVVLSCEVGAAKPEAGIYQAALSRLHIGAGEALFVDDQHAYCRGASALGIDATRISRGGPDGEDAVTSLMDLAHLF